MGSMCRRNTHSSTETKIEEKEACTQSCRKSGTGTSSQHPLAGSNTEMRKQWETSFLGSLRRVFSSTQLRLLRALERHSVAFTPDLGDAMFVFVINYKGTASCQTCNCPLFSYAAGIRQVRHLTLQLSHLQRICIGGHTYLL